MTPPDPPSPEDVDRLLAAAAAGRQDALDQLLPIVYDELRRLARAYMRRERPGQTIQATALVHEAYLRLMREPNTRWQNCAHFCAIAARDAADSRRARPGARPPQRAGDRQRVTLSDVAADPAAGVAAEVEALDEALTRLAVLDTELARLVELRYFGGLSIEETAVALGLSPATTKRRWAVARAWLKSELDPG